MNRINLWLECLTMEEAFLLTYGCIFALALVAIPIVWFIEKRYEEKSGTERQTEDA